MSQIELKFEVAVDFVRSLPKDGPLQPSDDTKLKFYSYFKQATEGKCDKPQPYFWDFVNKAKWQAWNDLGDMTKEEAMTHYCEALQKTLTENPGDPDAELQAKIDKFNSL